MELFGHLKTKEINLAIITETKKKHKDLKDIEDYIMIYNGAAQYQRTVCGIAIFINRKWKRKLDSYRWLNERIITLRI